MSIHVGNICTAEVGRGQVRFFHHVINDSLDLYANVIRVFKPTYSDQPLPDVSAVLAAETDFHCRTLCSLGIRLGLWQKVGHRKPAQSISIWFRSSGHYGNPEIKVSNNWSVWKVNQPKAWVGKLPTKYQNAELGPVVAPIGVVQRIRTGDSGYFYPVYE